jgi:hypothetical protein
MSFGFVTRRRSKKPVDRSTAPQNELIQGRCIACFGPPSAGTSLILKILHEESTTKTTLLDKPTFEDVVKARKQTKDVIFFDGFPTTAEEVQDLYDQRWVTGIEGAVIRFVVDRGTVLRRAEIPHDELESFHEQWMVYQNGLGVVEERIRRLSLPYFCVNIEDLETAVGDLARRCGIRD